ncbi:hypothetical protein DSCW_05600 [Desulfosarcina widdelii]|uniref:Uncharacterized protein n=1 Tax=Desulfosarcina widdelii TaxID=947919 RepID=A0A5K7YYY5_9BACT|nr:hypothetical protein DSCW_05600 [Desulfosarcina widdelii]
MAEIGPLLACLIEPALFGWLSEVEADRIYDRICFIIQNDAKEIRGAVGVGLKVDASVKNV